MKHGLRKVFHVLLDGETTNIKANLWRKIWKISAKLALKWR